MRRLAIERAIVAGFLFISGTLIGLGLLGIVHGALSDIEQRLLLVGIAYACASAAYTRRRLTRLIARHGTGLLTVAAALALGPFVAPREIWHDVRAIVE